ncbi:hypothetical protein [Prochlorococcus marinus]|uniref:hypothetical protein n=1 Tax=Prochlorococcus marinus TaxID=1219 RepID=UPI001AD9F0B1|nr:hypothetical protein [Prochlorococcus marinus]MBO8204755.1 hypothetical protein [Prochlorococcus marinus CUG1415]MBW3044043.1 hypothetical protein [Prochlorococcus marinus str. MU1415]
MPIFFVELLLPIIIIIVLPFIAIPQFINVQNRAKSSAALNIVRNIAKECLDALSKKDLAYTFSDVELPGYQLFPLDGNCKGDGNNLIKAKSENTKKYPTYSYNTVTGEKTCSHDGQNDELNGCSAKRNGEW